VGRVAAVARFAASARIAAVGRIATVTRVATVTRFAAAATRIALPPVRLLRIPGVFFPISDSWMLASCLRRESLGPTSAVLDLGTGSGMLAVSAGLAGAGSVVAVDVSRRALFTARLNGLLNGVRLETRRGDMFDAVPDRRFDVIVSNPPYVPGPEVTPRGLARAWEAGETGRRFLDRICQQSPPHLRPGGVVLLVQSTICGERETLDMLAAGGLSAQVVFRHHGKLGPLLRERRGWLRERGLLAGDRDEVIVVRAQAEPSRETPGRTPAGAAAPGARPTSRLSSRH
jgi:release factor glutamine methyltransferase